ncbi:hypothetical protein Phi4:1_gp023 [Cellulophaga phage phi4:1]|uniref:Uncharacterized protein n=5 Tax=Lightbulbvirus TaxID=1918522 RepID=A0A0S2MWD7_9CAUD|nr:hypothetical protein Phi4:1_gp023 [Cellulophaga phage phi4:1]YP_008241518.1 hypothetical protein Phi17:2_gp023 [Cellulophaga phage phi17:2]ALO80032.1 hypothetical protein Phi4113_023 [Cellulophaga phage phi4:1_13]ALO80229.1 hypothetical protein Phi4118_023 [Cellulophaga phage phi4:1_18]ALO80426.1 hypothetical protein Phi17218_023 [Cellulophaga phage phi17:2_18]AGO47556.1 hypothetical protein Phi17:2_gp023 [Cellulophaga phage phi17:2]AGO49436.1 hypothetical protein Phi4:1_gp023 [Cellulophag
MWSAFLEIFGGFVLISLATISSQAVNHMYQGTFKKEVFLKTNIKPFIWTVIAGTLISIYSVFLPEYTFFIETITGGNEIDTKNIPGLFASASILGTMLKAFLGKPTIVAEAEILKSN